MNEGSSRPSPGLFSRTIVAAEQSSILAAALELDVFSALGRQALNASALASRCGASKRGIRILCDCLVVMGFLTKESDRYALTPDSATFLDANSPQYAGAAVTFLRCPERREGFDRFADAVRAGGAVISEQGLLGPEDPIWETFARSMAPLAAVHAQALAECLPLDPGPIRILDIGAGHGLYGITLARPNPRAEVTAVDWPGVLEVATENAEKHGMADRYRLLPGNALEIAFGGGYDMALLTGFLHLLDAPTCEELLRRTRAALGEGGCAVIVDFIPDEDRVAPPVAAIFAAIMLVTTPAGDAYTFDEYSAMVERAGFARCALRDLDGSPQRAVMAYR